MAKVSNDSQEIILETPISTTQSQKEWYNSSSSGTSYVTKENYWPYNYPTFYGKMVLDMSSSYAYNFRLNNGEAVRTNKTNQTLYSNELTSGTKVQLQLAATSGSEGRQYYYTVKRLDIISMITGKWGDAIKWYPRASKEIWEKTSTTLFWEHIDGSWINDLN